MGSGRRRIRRFLCFGVPAGVVVEEAAEKSSTSSISAGSSGITDPELRHRRRLLRRIATRLVRSLSSQSLNRSGRLRDDLSRSLSKKALEATKSLPESMRKSMDDDRRTDPIFTISASSSSSSASSLFSSDSSSSSSSSSSSFPPPETAIPRRKRTPPMAVSKKTAPDPVRRRNYDLLTGLCLLVVSLSVMVFCGRVWAILWTSTWLCLLPGRIPSAAPAEAGEAAVVEELADFRPRGCDECEKKRIVLEGLLERSRKV